MCFAREQAGTQLKVFMSFILCRSLRLCEIRGSALGKCCGDVFLSGCPSLDLRILVEIPIWSGKVGLSHGGVERGVLGSAVVTSRLVRGGAKNIGSGCWRGQY